MFEDLNLKLGFGCMRLPKQGEEIDIDAFSKMVDAYLAAGGRYFDTAHVYHKGASEPAIRKALTSRYSRDRYILTDKLTTICYETEDDLDALLEKQLQACGVEYFDNYFFHAMRPNYYEKFNATNAFAHMKKWLQEGKIRHIGMSFHWTPEFLRQVLTEHPEIEIVQLQFNYADTDNPDVQALACYEVCREFDKPVVVMEPVKGGTLADLPQEGKEILRSVTQNGEATFALRYCASFPQIKVILSGMSSPAQMEDNLKTMASPAPFTESEYAAADQIRGIVRKTELIACTGCRYCMDGCPQEIPIPELFAAYNARLLLEPYSMTGQRAVDCAQCGACESLCPQNLPIRKLLKWVAESLA